MPHHSPYAITSLFCFSFVPAKTLVVQPVLKQVEEVLMFDLSPLAKGETVEKGRPGHFRFWPGNALFAVARLAFAVTPEVLWRHALVVNVTVKKTKGGILVQVWLCHPQQKSWTKTPAL